MIPVIAVNTQLQLLLYRTGMMSVITVITQLKLLLFKTGASCLKRSPLFTRLCTEN